LKALDRPSFWNWIVPGVLIGISAQFRPNILVLLPLLVVCMWLGVSVDSKSNRLKEIGVFLLGASFILGPVAMRNRIVGGEWVLTTAHGGMNFYTGNNPPSAAPYRPLPFARTDPKYEQDDFYAEAMRRAGRELTRDEASQFWYGETARIIREDIAGWLKLLAKKFQLIWSNYEQPINQNFYFYKESFWLLRPLSIVGYWLLAPLGIFGVLLSLRNRTLLPLHAYLLAQIISLVAFFVVSEYRHPMTLALTVYAALSFDWFRAQMNRGGDSWKKIALALVMLVAISVSAGRAAPGDLAYRQDLAVAYNSMGALYMTTGRCNEAIPALQKSLAILSDYGDAHYNLGECYIQLNKPAEAKFHLLEGMRIHPNFVPQHYHPLLASAYAELGDWNGAKQELMKGMDSDPANSANFLNLALVYRQTGQRLQAAALLDKLLAAQPANGQALFLATEIAVADNNKRRVFELLPRLASASPTDPAARDLIGRALAADGHYQEAKGEFERALALNPDFKPAKINLERTNRILASHLK
jgi:tetratricopeptide (TPR) repeat protein